MESQNGENVQQINDEFKIWIAKFREQMSIKNQELKSRLHAKQQTNKELMDKIEKLSNSSLNISTLAIDVIPAEVGTRLKNDVKNLKTNSEQLNKCNETINARIEEESRKLRNKCYEMITKDDISLKPFHEVEEAIDTLTQKTDICINKTREDKENFIKNLKERELVFTEITQNITMLEPVVQDMRLAIQNCNTNFEEKLVSLKLNSLEEANDQSTESKQLLDDISNMKSNLNIK